MPKFLDTRSNKPVAIAICARCSRKFPYTELIEDSNYPGLWVCLDDWDTLDPYRLPARETEDITLEHPRPDVSVAVFPSNAPTIVGQLLFNQPSQSGLIVLVAAGFM